MGPTHDDITFESVAQAFDEKCEIHPDLHKIVEDFFGKVAIDSPQMKMCTVPKSTQLLYKGAEGKLFKYPVVTVQNVYVLPGIPQLFERTIDRLVGYWESRNRDIKHNNYFCIFLNIYHSP